MREWLTVIIVLLIIGIILDGIRRVRTARRERIHMANDLPDAKADDLIGGSEFPRGGARIAGYRHPDDTTASHHNTAASFSAKAKSPHIHTKVQSKAHAEVAPVLMDSTEDNEPSLGDFSSMELDADVAVATPVRVAAPIKPGNIARPANANPAKPAVKKADVVAKSSGQQQSAEQTAPEEVIVINVMAHQGQYFDGAQLLDVLTTQNMRFGFMDIFHRHKNEDGSGESLFSLANIVKPGTFDLNTIEDFTTPGISMFLMLPLKGDSVAAFGLMARTAKAIAQALDGELKDEHRSVMTQQTFEHCRQRVIEFERKRRLNR